MGERKKKFEILNAKSMFSFFLPPLGVVLTYTINIQ